MIPCTKKLGRSGIRPSFFAFFVMLAMSDAEAADGFFQFVGEL